MTGKDGPANHAAALREGPLRLRLRQPSRPADRAADPQGRRAEVGRRRGRSRQSLDAFPRGHLGRGDGARRRRACSRSASARAARALAGFGSAKGSNEEAYLFQKLVRTGFDTNNVDHCTRLCHASSVAALFEGIGSGAVTAPFSAALDAETHHRDRRQPDAAIIRSRRPSSRTRSSAAPTLIVADPRGQGLSRHATINMRFKPGSDVALLNAMLHTIITEELTDKQYIAGFTEGFPELAEKIGGFSPEAMEPVCGVPAETIRTVARMYARSQGLDHLLGHGHLAARARHRQCALPDRAGAGHRPGRRGPAPGCIRCAARTTCRARRTPA